MERVVREILRAKALGDWRDVTWPSLLGGDGLC